MDENQEVDLNKYPYSCEKGHHFDDSFVDPQTGCIGCEICYKAEKQIGDSVQVSSAPTGELKQKGTKPMNAKQWIVVVMLSIAAILYFFFILLPIAFPSEQKQDCSEPNEPEMILEFGECGDFSGPFSPTHELEEMLKTSIAQSDRLIVIVEDCLETIEILKDSEPEEPCEPKFYTTEELDRIFKDEPALGSLAKDLHGIGEHTVLFIPTAPDYIELPKTLLIEGNIKCSNWSGIDFTRYNILRLDKGTRIYCEEN